MTLRALFCTNQIIKAMQQWKGMNFSVTHTPESCYFYSNLSETFDSTVMKVMKQVKYSLTGVYFQSTRRQSNKRKTDKE